MANGMRKNITANRIVVLVLAIGSVAFAGCDDISGPENALAKARARWSANRPTAYAFTIVRDCNCFDQAIGPVRVTVANGTVQSQIYTYNSQTVTSQYAGLFPDIDGLFALIQAAFEANAARVDGTYDASAGYPREVFIDYAHPTVDDELRITIRDFERR